MWVWPDPLPHLLTCLCYMYVPLDDPDEADKYERLLQELVVAVGERDNIVQQVEMDRVR